MPRVALVGTGLIGGSIGLALRRAGMEVRAFDTDPERTTRAVALGAVDEIADSIEDVVRGADVTIVATPVGHVAELVVAALEAGAPVVTDVGSVKAPILRAVQLASPDLAARFVGGHPMAGSEQDGLDGAAVDLFAGATWVLTPTSRTDAGAHTAVRSLVAELGAEIIEVTPEHHDAIVAVVSHVPQLAATTLMDVATTTGEEQAILLRLAAGGFRDMTRIAAGDPGIWPDICIANRDAIVAALDEYLRALAVVRGLVAAGDGDALLRVLKRARSARRNLPRRATVAGPLVELRVPVPDRPGVLAEVTTLAGRLGVNIADFEIAHSIESEGGVIVMVVAAAGVEAFARALIDAGYHPAEPAPMTLPAELVLHGGRPLRGRLRLPGCKGISHRALLFAAMADGRSRIANLADGDDVARTGAALERLGVRLRPEPAGAVSLAAQGVTAFREPEVVLDCGNSGTTMRMLCGLLAGRPFLSVLTGDESLSRRPMQRVLEPLRGMGARVDGRANGSLAPLTIRGGELRGVQHELKVASGQVKTALVLAGLSAEGTTEIVEPAPSRDHTERMLAALGAPVERVDDRRLTVRAGAPEPFELTVPGDASSAAFFVVAASIVPGSAIVLEDVSLNPGRIEYLELLRAMGARIEVEVTETRVGEPVGNIAVEAAPLHGIDIAGREAIIDELPVLAVAGAFADGVTTIHDAAELAVKESNRIGALEQELTQLGIGVEARPDGLVVRGGSPRGATTKSHGDHRIALAAAVAGLGASGETTVRGWPVVAISYPRFEADLADLLGDV